MKTAETKSASTSHLHQAGQPFFQKNGESAFFLDNQTDLQTKPFFSKQKTSPFIQPKLTIGRPGDKYEQEADTMADRVVQRLSNPETLQTKYATSLANTVTPLVQPKCAACEEENKLQKKEEDEELPEDNLQLKPIFESDAPPPEDEVQRKCAGCEEEEKIQKKEEDDGLHAGSGPEQEIPDLSTVSDGGLQKPLWDFHQQLNTSKGGGSPLDSESREMMGAQFGADFSGVRIHTGSQASEMNKGLNSQAFTHKNDIYFNEGKFNPSTTSGKHLLAHELTHTIQQGNSRPGIQKSNDKSNEAEEIDPTKLPLKDGQMNSSKTEITFDSIPIPDFKVKDHRKAFYDAAKPLKRMKGYNTDLRPKYEQYNQNWLKGIDSKTIKGILMDKLIEKKVFEGDENPYVFKSLSKSKKSNPYYFYGKLDDIANQLKKPMWGGTNTNPPYVRMTLDHIVELQLANWNINTESNKESNLELLEGGVNSESGNIIKINIDERVNRFNKATGNQLTGGLTGQEAQKAIKNKYTLVFNDTVRSNKGRRSLKAEDFWTLDQIEKGKHLNAVKVAHFNDLEEEGTVRIFPKPGARPKTFKWAPGMEEKIGSKEKNWFGKYILITRKEFDTTGTGEELGHFRVNADPAFLKKYHLVYSGKDIVIPIKRMDGSPSVGAVEKASASQVLMNWFKSMSFKPMSPVQVDHIDFNDLGEIEAQGIIEAELPFIRGTRINFKIENGDIQIYKEFTGHEFHMPPPFKLNQTSLLIFVDSGKGVGINGSVDFGIEKFGEGQISAMLTPSQFSFAGKFNIESDAFDPAFLMVSYVKELGDGQVDNGKEPEWEIYGIIGLKKQVKGIKEAVLEIKYANNTIEGLGNVDLDIPAIEGGELHAMYDTKTKDFSITAELQLRKDIPGIKGGCIGVTVSREGATGEYALGIVGSAQPHIPGLENVNLCIAYQNGVFAIQGEAGFEKGIASGKVKLGVTNRPVGENGQPEEGISNKLTAYGSGSLTIKFSEFLQGTVGATVTPEGRVILVGEIKIPDRISLTGEPVKFNEEIIKFPTISIPIIGVSALGKTVGIAAKIGGGVNAYATLGPLWLTELSLNIKEFDPMEPEQAEVYGIAAVDYPAIAGIKAHMSVGVELSILILKAGGELIGGMKLELSTNAGGKIKLKWTPMRGLEFIEAIAHAEASAQMILDLKGRLYADLDLLLKTINLWEQETTLAERQFGPQLQIGINVPLKVEDGKLKGIDFKDIEFIKPNLENKSEQDKLMENAIEESKKPKKPEPPGKEETLKMIRSLPAKASGGINIFRFNSERYSYIFKLQTQYPEQDWSFIFPELKKIENNELYNFRNAVFRIDKGFPGMSLVEYRLFMVNIFKKDHKYVDKEQVDALRSEVIDVGE